MFADICVVTSIWLLFAPRAAQKLRHLRRHPPRHGRHALPVDNGGDAPRVVDHEVHEGQVVVPEDGALGRVHELREDLGQEPEQLARHAEHALGVLAVGGVGVGEGGGVLFDDDHEVRAQPVVGRVEGPAGDGIVVVGAGEEYAGDDGAGLGGFGRVGVGAEGADAAEAGGHGSAAEELGLELGDARDEGFLLGHGHAAPAVVGGAAGHELHEDPLEADLAVAGVVEGHDLGHGHVGLAAHELESGDLAAGLVSRVDGQRHAHDEAAARAVDEVQLVVGAGGVEVDGAVGLGRGGADAEVPAAHGGNGVDVGLPRPPRGDVQAVGRIVPREPVARGVAHFFLSPLPLRPEAQARRRGAGAWPCRWWWPIVSRIVRRAEGAVVARALFALAAD